VGRIHMGELLERAIRRKGLNITELAYALGITRRTMYNWFKQEVIDEVTMERISSVINYEFNLPTSITVIAKNEVIQSLVLKDDAYWQNKYIDLLERYTLILKDIS
jgi:predicted transcriptional regulator